MEKTLRKTNKKGFTLVELVIVIAVLAILASIAVPTVTNVINDANTSADAANAQTIELALKSAYSEAIAGTWKNADGTAVDTTALKVSQALTHEGIGALPDAKVSGAHWRYEDGKVFLVTGTDGTPFDKDSPVHTVINVPTT